MTKDEALTLALEALYNMVEDGDRTDKQQAMLAIAAIEEALAQPDYRAVKTYHEGKPVYVSQPEQEPVACVYKATTKKGETAHFGEYSSAKAWAGWGSVEQVSLKTLTLISKSIKPCPTCEALARTVMLDQTSHDTTPPRREWVGLTDEDLEFWTKELGQGELGRGVLRAVADHLKEKNT